MAEFADGQELRTIIHNMYGSNEAFNPVFPTDGYFNFGYWGDSVPSGELTLEQRDASQRALYAKMFAAAQIGPEDIVLDLGCGRGGGPKQLAETIGPVAVFGIDRLEAQVQRTSRYVAGVPGVHVVQAEVERLPFAEWSFSRAVSLEAIQHFNAPRGFAHELGRVVRPGGKVAIASFFALERGVTPDLQKLLPTFAENIDRAVYIGDITRWLRESGFGGVAPLPIGEYVWEPFVRWRNQVRKPESSGWLDAYQRGLLDYFLITATKQT